jgi:hypothetical protein
MRGLSLILAVGMLGMGCGKTVYRSHEAQYCSNTEADDPYFECSPSYDLVCINTYAEPVLQPAGAPPKYQEIFLCRLACNPGDLCPDLKDVCCPGIIYGETYGKTHACVPAGRCQTVSPTDAGTDTRRDTAADSPAADAPADGPADSAPGPDVSPDTATPDAGSPDASAG